MGDGMHMCFACLVNRHVRLNAYVHGHVVFLYKVTANYLSGMHKKESRGCGWSEMFFSFFKNCITQ